MNILERLGLIAESIIDFFSKIPSEIKEYAEKAIPVVNDIKEALNSGTAVDITNLIPGTWDDGLRIAASNLCAGLIAIFKSVDESDVDEEIKNVAKGKLLLGMGSGIVALMDNNELPGNRYDAYTQIAYSNQKKDK